MIYYSSAYNVHSIISQTQYTAGRCKYIYILSTHSQAQWFNIPGEKSQDTVNQLSHPISLHIENWIQLNHIFAQVFPFNKQSKEPCS
jgi:hypothetical protein